MWCLRPFGSNQSPWISSANGLKDPKTAAGTSTFQRSSFTRVQPLTTSDPRISTASPGAAW